MLISILVFDGVDEFDCIAPLEILRHAAGIDDRHHIELVTCKPVAQITTAHGLRIEPDNLYAGNSELLIVPGGGWVNHAENGIRAEIEGGPLLPVVTDAHAAGTCLAAVCTGAMALAHAGLLDGRLATTHTSALADLRAFEAINVIEARVVDDGDIMTSGGVTSAIDLALWLVERSWNAAIANDVGRYIEYTRSEPVIGPGGNH